MLLRKPVKAEKIVACRGVATDSIAIYVHQNALQLTFGQRPIPHFRQKAIHHFRAPQRRRIGASAINASTSPNRLDSGSCNASATTTEQSTTNRFNYRRPALHKATISSSVSPSLSRWARARRLSDAAIARFTSSTERLPVS